MKEFFKKWIFFRINPDEKEIYRDRVMKTDHKTYRVLLIAISILQAFMLIFALTSRKDESNWYTYLYMFLLVVCIVSLILIEILFSKNKKFAYYLVVSLVMTSIMLWGAGISLLDSRTHRDLAYFTLAMITAGLFITLEPWVTILTSLSVLVLFDVAFIVASKNGSISSHVGFGYFVTSTSVAVISCIGSTINFMRRVKAIKLELEVSELNKTLKEQSYIDNVTNVRNRRYLTENISKVLKFKGPYTGIVMMDLDNFKIINDTFGHQVGDNCLEIVGRQLNLLVKDKNASAIRYGGDEFLIYFAETDKQEIEQFIKDVKKGIKKAKIKIDGINRISFTISAGYALANEDMTFNDLISEADKNLYADKHIIEKN